MSKISAIFIEKMWGYKNVHLELNESINFLIGVNGSGKTTII
ncbi:TPA: AAA family ATPase, partial [Enterobacter hormaechei]|nr:AAA family ATPase [Enterobacter hormaechei]